MVEIYEFHYKSEGKEFNKEYSSKEELEKDRIKIKKLYGILGERFFCSRIKYVNKNLKRKAPHNLLTLVSF